MWLKIETELREPVIAVVRLQGRIVLGRDSQDLEWKIQKLLADQRRLILLDLSGVTHIDSTGVGILVMSAGKAKASGAEVRIVGPTGNVAEVLRVTKIGQIVPVFATAEEALAMGSAKAG